MQYAPGTLLSFKWDDGNLGVCKVITTTETAEEPIINITTFSNCFEAIPEAIATTELKPLVLHMPMTLTSIQASDCSVIGFAEVTPEEYKGFEKWLAAWQNKRAGVFEIPIVSAINHIIEAMAQVNSSSPDSAFRQQLKRHWQDKAF